MRSNGNESAKDSSHTMNHLPRNEATQSAMEAAADQDLRVPCYCEENVYRLVSRKLAQKAASQSTMTTNTTCNTSLTDGGPSYYVAFVSSETQCVPMFFQIASKTPSSSLCFWDYHVIAIQVSADNSNDKEGPVVAVLDMDSLLPYPCPLDTYVHSSFPQDIPTNYEPLFRVIRSDMFLQHFFSDRHHMRNKDGTWMATPPGYATILSPKGSEGTVVTSNLDLYRTIPSHRKESENIGSQSKIESSEISSMLNTEPYGVVLTQDQLLLYFLGKLK